VYNTHLRATGCQLSYGITQCYLPPDTGELNAPGLTPTGKAYEYSIYLPRRGGRLSWPRWLVTYQMVYPPAHGHSSKY